MLFPRCFTGAFLLLAIGQAAILRGTPSAPTEADVQSLRKKLTTLESGLQGMSGSFDSTKLGPELKMLLNELHQTLADTSTMKDHALAMKKLEAARDGMTGLVKELTARQVEIMKESEAEKQSLLLGVLMTHQKEPMPEQLELLKNQDFADLDVAKALLKSHDNSTALFTQAAMYLDKHAGKTAEQELVTKAQKAQAKVETMAASFEKRVKTMEAEFAKKEKRHNERMTELKNAASKAKGQSQHVIQSVMKREARKFKKYSVSQKHDIETMKSAAVAIRNGDMKALERAKTALEQSMKNMQSKNSGFIVLLTLGHQFMERDCPYCAAQCIDKCHAAGNPYTQCMTSCADAGK